MGMGIFNNNNNNNDGVNHFSLKKKNHLCVCECGKHETRKKKQACHD
jgi:hypothetical protein